MSALGQKRTHATQRNGRYSIASNGVAAITKMVTINLRFANIYAGVPLAMMVV